MEFEFNPRNVEKLIELANKRTLGLPDFQREYIWRPPDVADLLCTVARDWPAGSFLLLAGPREFACKEVDGAPPLGNKDPTLLILDGQQRITALYQAFTGESREVYYVDIRALQEVGELENEHIRYEKKTKFDKKYPSTKEMAEQSIISVPQLANDRQFNRWLNFFSDEEQDALIDLRDNQLSGFKSYSVPCVTLPIGVSLSALAKIFETINRTGVRLDAFDLMVAKLYPYDFRLRDEWKQAKVDSPLLEGFNVDGIEILKLIALMEHVRQVGEPGPTRVKGVRESDVLELEPAKVKQLWSTAVASYEEALVFLKSRCSVITPGLLPAKPMVLSIAFALRKDESRRSEFEPCVEKWFWVATFQQVYSQGANTQAVKDAKALRAWNSDPSAIPEDVRGFKFDIDSLQDQKRRNEILARGVACLLIKRGARDWIHNNKTLADESEVTQIQLHHVFASKYLKNNLDFAEGNLDLVVNFTPLLASSNQSLREESPVTVAKRNDVSKSAVESHFVEWDLFSEGHWKEFRQARSKRLEELIKEAVK